MAAIMSSEDDFQGKRKRASVMTSAELCMISQHYVENYSLFHAAHAGSSRDPSVKEKKKCLEDLADVLEQAGYERRSTAQLDQRIRDTLRRAKQYTAAMKKDQMQTGGGPPKKFDIPAHVQIILKGCGDKPRLHGLEKPMEVCGTYDSDLDDDFFERKPPKIRHIEASPPQQPRHTDTSPQLHPSHVEAITPQKPRLPKNYSGPQPHLGETCSTPQPRLAEAYSTPQSRHPRRNQPQHPTRSLPSPHEKENQSELNKHAEAKTALLALEREHIGLKLENEKKRATLLEMQLQNEHWKQEILRSQHNALLNAPAVPHFADL